MRKALLLGLACLALLAMVAAPTFACDGNKTTSASTSNGTDGKMVSSDSKGTCAGAKNATATSADAKSCCAAHGSMTTASAADCSKCPYAGCEMVNMSIKGMTCGGCESTVRASLEKVPGVMKVMSVSYKDGTALVCMDPKKCTRDNLTSAVSNKGYEAEVIPAVATTTTTDGKVKSCAGMDKTACAAKCAGKADGAAKTDQDSK